MFRGSIGFKKDKPLTTYSNFNAYTLRQARNQTYRDEEQVDVMEVYGQKQTITIGSTTISEKYLAGGEGYDMGGNYGGDMVIVVFQTNANNDLLAYVIKGREELGSDFETYRHVFMGMMTDEIWNTMQGRFSTTLTVSTSSGTITISDGSQSILVNASNHNMRYNADYYTETSDTSTEYTTLQTNGWLVNGTYTYQGVNQDWNTIIDSLKAKGIVNATITHDTANGEITIANGQWSFTIMDKNLGASVVYENGDTLSEENCGKYYSRGNNYGYARNGPIETAIGQIDTTGYGPGNYYSDYTFRVCQSGSSSYYFYDWSNPSNNDLWGDTTNTEAARQGPCPSGYHIPTSNELFSLIKLVKIINPTGNIFETLKIPKAGRCGGNYTQASINGHGETVVIWTSSVVQTNYVYGYARFGNNSYEMHKIVGASIRPFKNTTSSS